MGLKRNIIAECDHCHKLKALDSIDEFSAFGELDNDQSEWNSHQVGRLGAIFIYCSEACRDAILKAMKQQSIE